MALTAAPSWSPPRLLPTQVALAPDISCLQSLQLQFSAHRPEKESGNLEAAPAPLGAFPAASTWTQSAPGDVVP